MRGFFGIGIINGKHEVNIGTLIRTAHIFGAHFVFTIGNRYNRQSTDTLNSTKHIPLYHYDTFEDFKSNLPQGCEIVLTELTAGATSLQEFKHPERAVYLLGAEDTGIPMEILNGDSYERLVKLPGEMSLNVSVAGSILMYDRILKYEQIRNNQA